LEAADFCSTRHSKYLDTYVGQKHAPGYLRKTWFINSELKSLAWDEMGDVT
jgi:hypothetical protein